MAALTTSFGNNSRTAAARSFLRSVNILLKFTRLYGFAHVRTAAQFKTTWSELQSTLAIDRGSGLLLGVSESKLLLDGVPVESSPAERGFADLLTRAGLASISFTPAVAPAEFTEFVKAFSAAGTKPGGLAAQLKEALGNNPNAGIRINEIRFVAEDEANARTGLAGQIAAQALGANSNMKEWLNDPQKLLQMIVAAEGAGKGGSGEGPGAAGRGAGPGAGQGGLLMEDDVVNVVRLLTGIHTA
ncbi:MAG TPA: hypothetical protein VGQ11_00900, partial [Candidatus Acidoferrales bacterium]|nr:hypothetical protein [Candidatus Acidoferrales bacterium]